MTPTNADANTPVRPVTDASARESFMYAQLAVRGVDTDSIGTALTIELSKAWDTYLAGVRAQAVAALSSPPTDDVREALTDRTPKHVPKLSQTGAEWQWICTCGRAGVVTRHRGNAARGALMHANAERRNARYRLNRTTAQFSPRGPVTDAAMSAFLEAERAKRPAAGGLREPSDAEILAGVRAILGGATREAERSMARDVRTILIAAEKVRPRGRVSYAAVDAAGRRLYGVSWGDESLCDPDLVRDTLEAAREARS